jgi:hypothetical protein
MQLLRKIHFYIIVFQVIILFTPFNGLLAQNSIPENLEEAKLYFDEAYGEDYHLVNGKKYVNFYASASGHAFLNEPAFESGWLKIIGQSYKDQVLNYDIYNQEVIAEHKSSLTGNQRYIVPNVFLDAFALGNREFQKLKIGDRKERFYEVISKGSYRILLTHEKMYSINRNANSQGFLFSETITKKYLWRDDELIRFKNNRSFRKLFPASIQDDIKTYMKKYRIRIRQADVEGLKRLMNHINQR